MKKYEYNLVICNLVDFFFQAGRKDRSDALNTAIDRMTKKTRDLRRQVLLYLLFLIFLLSFFLSFVSLLYVLPVEE